MVLSVTDQLILDMQCLISGTENGSLHQWLANDTGDRYDFVVDHLHKIGARAARDTVLKLKQIFPGNSVPFSQETRHRYLWPEGDHDPDDLFDLCDTLSSTLLYECEDIYLLSVEYIEALGYSEKFSEASPGEW